MNDQRALLDECTRRTTCPARLHLSGCPGSPACPYCQERGRHLASCRHAGNDSLPVVGPQSQLWTRPEKRPAPGVRRPEMRLHLVVDDTGRALVHEAVLAQLLTDAGWERTA